MIALAFVLGLFSLGLVRADVSHLRGSHRYQPAFGSNNEQFSRQQSGKNFNTRYWWMNTDDTQQPGQVLGGCQRCASRALNIKHIHDIHREHTFSQQKPIVVMYNDNQPQEYVSESFAPQSYNFGRIQQQSSVCSSSNSACVTPKLCLNGFIDQSIAHNILRSSVSITMKQKLFF